MLLHHQHLEHGRGGQDPSRHAVIELVNANLKNSALTHLPSSVFTPNAAWLVLAVMAFNLTRAAGTIAGTGLAKSTTATIRRKLVSDPPRDVRRLH